MFSKIKGKGGDSSPQLHKPRLQKTVARVQATVPTYRYTEVSLITLLSELTGESDRPFSSRYTWEHTIGAEGSKRELVTLYTFKENVVEIKSEGSNLLNLEDKNLFSIKGNVSITEFKEIVIDYLNTTTRRRKHLNLPSVDSCGDINRLKALLSTPSPKYVIKPRKAPIVISYEDILKNEEAILNLLQDKLILTSASTVGVEPKRFRVRVEKSKPPADLPSILMEIKKLGDELHLFFASSEPFWADVESMLIAINNLLVEAGLGYVIARIPKENGFFSFTFTTNRKEQKAILQLLNSN